LHAPAMGSHDCFDIEPLLVAKVVIHCGDVGARPLTDVTDSRTVEASFGEDFARSFRNPFASCVDFIGGHRKTGEKPSFQTFVSINCIDIYEMDKWRNQEKEKGWLRDCEASLNYDLKMVYGYSSSPPFGSAPPNSISRLLGADGCGGAVAAPSPFPP